MILLVGPTASSRRTVGGGGGGPSFTTTYDGLVTDLTPVAMWGTVQRNSAYTGPALRVINNSTLAETDVNFDSEGFVTAVRPYGDDTRVITLYDQFGTENLTATAADNVQVIGAEPGTNNTWRLKFTGDGGFVSPSTADQAPAWALGDPFWVIGVTRTKVESIQGIWGVESTGGTMDIGLYQEQPDLNVRVDGGSSTDFGSSQDMTTSPIDNTHVYQRVIGDMSNQTQFLGYVESTSLSASRTYTSPVDYEAFPLEMGTTIETGINFEGEIVELAIFNPAVTMGTTERQTVLDAMGQVTENRHSTPLVSEQRVYAINTDGLDVNVQEQRAYIISDHPDIEVHEQRVYVILEP